MRFVIAISNRSRSLLNGRRPVTFVAEGGTLVLFAIRVVVEVSAELDFAVTDDDDDEG